MLKFFDGQTDGQKDGQSDYYRAPAYWRGPNKALKWHKKMSNVWHWQWVWVYSWQRFSDLKQLGNNKII